MTEKADHRDSAQDGQAQPGEASPVAPPEDVDALLRPMREAVLPPSINIGSLLTKDISDTMKKLAEIGKGWADSPMIDARRFEQPVISPRLLETPITLPPSAAVETARVRQEISAMATIAQAQLEELGALQVAITDLKGAVDTGQRKTIWPTRVTIGLGVVVVIETLALVYLAWAQLLK